MAKPYFTCFSIFHKSARIYFTEKAVQRTAFSGAGKGTLRSLRCLVGLRPARAVASFATRGGKRRHWRLFLSALRVPSFISNKKPMTAHGLFYLVEIRGLEPLASALRTPRYTNLAISPRHKIFYNISARNAIVLFWLDGTNFAAGQKNLLFPIDFRPPSKYTIPCPLRRTQLNTAA